MAEMKVICVRCRGRKKLYKFGPNGYSTTNTGGALVDCPMCLGEGKMVSLKAALEALPDNVPIVEPKVMENAKKATRNKAKRSNTKQA